MLQPIRIPLLFSWYPLAPVSRAKTINDRTSLEELYRQSYLDAVDSCDSQSRYDLPLITSAIVPGFIDLAPCSHFIFRTGDTHRQD